LFVDFLNTKAAKNLYSAHVQKLLLYVILVKLTLYICSQIMEEEQIPTLDTLSIQESALKYRSENKKDKRARSARFAVFYPSSTLCPRKGLQHKLIYHFMFIHINIESGG
jgi:hypothetical protein